MQQAIMKPSKPSEVFEMVRSSEIKNHFAELNVLKNVRFEQESQFALQALQKNDFLMSQALKAPHTLRAAIYNIAAIGLSLNPASAHAYLVPRDGQVCLDISYRGLKRIATDSGAIEWCKAELVYESDDFQLNDVNEAPTHKRNPFAKDRGKIVGAYCVAKLLSGDYMTEAMSSDELDKVRSTSKAKTGPWATWPEEMMKKTVIKRASKSWPETENKERWDRAVEVLNEYDGCAYTLEQEKHFHHLLNKGEPLEFLEFMRDIGEEASIALYNSAPKGEKMKLKGRVDELNKEAHTVLDDAASDLAQCIESGDLEGCLEIVEDVDGLIDMVKARMTQQDVEKLEGLMEANNG